MDADEKVICNFLKSAPGQFVGLKEICRRAGGKWRFREDEDWAIAPLLRLVARGLVEDDKDGHYRLIPPPLEKTKPKWVSPHIRKILEQSGKSFDIDPREED